jgi:hypothetical protein
MRRQVLVDTGLLQPMGEAVGGRRAQPGQIDPSPAPAARGLANISETTLLIGDTQERCPHVGIEVIRKILRERKLSVKLACLGRGTMQDGGKGKIPNE